MKKRILIFIVLTSFATYSFKLARKDLVPDKETAIKIAEAVWLAIYGESIYTKAPFNAVLNGDTIWHVYGSLPPAEFKINSNGDSVLTMTQGGVPHILIHKSDGKIFDVYHTK